MKVFSHLPFDCRGVGRRWSSSVSVSSSTPTSPSSAPEADKSDARVRECRCWVSNPQSRSHLPLSVSSGPELLAPLSIRPPTWSPSEGSPPARSPPTLTPRAVGYISREDFKNDSRNYIQPVARRLRLGAKSESGRLSALSIAVSAFQNVADRGASPRSSSLRYRFSPPRIEIAVVPGALLREWAQSPPEGGLRITPNWSGNGDSFVLFSVFLCEIFYRKSFRFESRARRLGKF